MPTEPVMSDLTSVLWYLSLPVLIYLSWRFIWLNANQCERIQAQQAKQPEAPPAES